METEWLADVVVILHLGYVAFVAFGFVAVPLGGVFRWEWVRNRLFRLLHLAAIGLVAVQAVVGVLCPLTRLEYFLRPGGAGGTFMGRIARGIVYHDLPGWAFTAGYVVLFALAIALYRLLPPAGRDGGAAGGAPDAAGNGGTPGEAGEPR